MTKKDWSKYLLEHLMQLVFGWPILIFVLTAIILDAAKIITVEKVGYAFFGGTIAQFMNYFFRVSPPSITSNEKENEPKKDN